MKASLLTLVAAGGLFASTIANPISTPNSVLTARGMTDDNKSCLQKLYTEVHFQTELITHIVKSGPKNPQGHEKETIVAHVASLVDRITSLLTGASAEICPKSKRAPVSKRGGAGYEKDDKNLITEVTKIVEGLLGKDHDDDKHTGNGGHSTHDDHDSKDVNAPYKTKRLSTLGIDLDLSKITGPIADLLDELLEALDDLLAKLLGSDDDTLNLIAKLCYDILAVIKLLVNYLGLPCIVSHIKPLNYALCDFVKCLGELDLELTDLIDALGAFLEKLLSGI